MEEIERRSGSLSIENDQSGNKVVRFASNQEQSSYIYKLPFELLEKIFCLLPLSDLHAVCQTSKLWRKIALYCYQQNYSTIRAMFTGCMRFRDHPVEHISSRFKQYGILDAFISKIQRFELCGKAYEFQYFLEQQSKFHALKTLACIYVDFTNIEIDKITELFGRIEWLRIYECSIDQSLLTKIFTSFQNIKRITFGSLKKCGTVDTQWLFHKYPNIERFEIVSCNVDNCFPLAQFLQLNPNIRKLAVHGVLIFNNKDLMKKASSTLDELAIFVDVSQCCWLYQLNELKELGFYKRLKVYHDNNSELTQNFIDELVLVNPNKLFFGFTKEPLKLSAVRTIEELCLIGCRPSREVADLEDVACNLENLKSIYFGASFLSHIMLFIRRAKKLRKFRIDRLLTNMKDRENLKIINLSQLNSERAKLSDAQKITMYVSEELFLATKWTGQELNLDLIELKHTGCAYWDHDFNADMKIYSSLDMFIGHCVNCTNIFTCDKFKE